MDAIRWYRDRSERAADSFEVEIQAAIDRIADSPQIFPEYDDDHRFITLGRYPFSLIYRIVGTRLVVMAVAHSKRREDYWRYRKSSSAPEESE